MIRVDPLARSLTPNELGVAVDPPRCLKPGPCEQVAHGEVSLSSAADDGGPGARPLELPELAGIEALVRRCEWFALCENEASHYEPHSILGSVPCCDRCATLARPEASS